MGPSVGFPFLSDATVLLGARLLDTALLGQTSLPLMARDATNDAAAIRVGRRKQSCNLMREYGREGCKSFLNAINRSCDACDKGARRDEQGRGKNGNRLVAESQIGDDGLESVESVGVVLPYPSVH